VNDARGDADAIDAIDEAGVRRVARGGEARGGARGGGWATGGARSGAHDGARGVDADEGGGDAIGDANRG